MDKIMQGWITSEKLDWHGYCRVMQVLCHREVWHSLCIARIVPRLGIAERIDTVGMVWPQKKIIGRKKRYVINGCKGQASLCTTKEKAK
jgi:hypothetical protein